MVVALPLSSLACQPHGRRLCDLQITPVGPARTPPDEFRVNARDADRSILQPIGCVPHRSIGRAERRISRGGRDQRYSRCATSAPGDERTERRVCAPFMMTRLPRQGAQSCQFGVLQWPVLHTRGIAISLAVEDLSILTKGRLVRWRVHPAVVGVRLIRLLQRALRSRRPGTPARDARRRHGLCQASTRATAFGDVLRDAGAS